MYKRITLFLTSILFAVSAFANPSGRYVALIPINPGVVAGVGGSLWTTSLWATNAGDRDIPLVCESGNCPVLKAHSTTRIDAPTFTVTHQGFFLHVPSSFLQPVFPDTLFFELRSTDSVTAPESAGTEVPIVRLSAFTPTMTALPHVPVNGHSRSRLRVYGTVNGDVTVRVVGIESNQELMSTTLTLTGADQAKITDEPILATRRSPSSRCRSRSRATTTRCASRSSRPPTSRPGASSASPTTAASSSRSWRRQRRSTCRLACCSGSLQFIPSLSAAKARDQWGSRDRGQFDAAMTTAIEWKVTAICSADPSLRSG